MRALLLGFLLAGPASAAAPRYLYVQADVANLRAKPDDGAAVVLRLPVNTTVLESEAREGFSAVEAILGDARGVKGFVRSEFLAATPLTVAGALEQAEAARGRNDLKTAFSWAERAVAIEGEHPGALAALSELATALGKKDRAKWAQTVLSGERVVYLAVCRAKDEASFPKGAKLRAELVAAFDPKHGPVAIPPESLGRLERELAIVPWFALSPGGKGEWNIPGAFAQPGQVPVWNETADGASPEMSAEERKLVLGSCPDKDMLFATAALEAPVEAPFDWKRAPPAVVAWTSAAGAGQRFNVRTLSAKGLETPKVTAIELTGGLVLSEQERALAGAAEVPLAFWGLLGRSGAKPQAFIGGAGDLFRSAGHAVIARLKLARTTLFVVPFEVWKPESSSNSNVAVVAVDDAGTIRQVEVQIAGSGC